MKKSMNKKRISFGIVALLLIAFAGFGIWNTLRGADNYEPGNTVSAMDYKRSQVLVSGKDYKLDKEQKLKHKNLEKKRKKAIELEEQDNTQNRDRTRRTTRPVNQNNGANEGEKDKSTQDGTEKGNEKTTPGDNKESRKPREQKAEDPDDRKVTDDDDDERSYYDLPPEEQAKRPVIKTSLIDGQTKKGTVLKFWVSATDSSGRDIPVFSNGSGSFTVWVDGAQVSSSGASDSKTTFKVPVSKNVVKVKITAVDRANYKRTITRTINMDLGGSEEPIGSVSVVIRAPSIGLGTIAGPMSIPITEHESAAEVLKDAFGKAGLSYSFSDHGNYLIGIGKKNIAKNAHISQELQKKLKDLYGEEAEIRNVDTWPNDRLHEKDFLDTSGWNYYVNGIKPGVSLGSFIPDDGDEIDLVFSLMDGKDL